MLRVCCMVGLDAVRICQGACREATGLAFVFTAYADFEGH